MSVVGYLLWHRHYKQFGPACTPQSNLTDKFKRIAAHVHAAESEYATNTNLGPWPFRLHVCNAFIWIGRTSLVITTNLSRNASCEIDFSHDIKIGKIIAEEKRVQNHHMWWFDVRSLSYATTCTLYEQVHVCSQQSIVNIHTASTQWKVPLSPEHASNILQVNEGIRSHAHISRSFVRSGYARYFCLPLCTSPRHFSRIFVMRNPITWWRQLSSHSLGRFPEKGWRLNYSGHLMAWKQGKYAKIRQYNRFWQTGNHRPYWATDDWSVATNDNCSVQPHCRRYNYIDVHVKCVLSKYNLTLHENFTFSCNELGERNRFRLAWKCWLQF